VPLAFDVWPYAVGQARPDHSLLSTTNIALPGPVRGCRTVYTMAGISVLQSPAA